MNPPESTPLPKRPRDVRWWALLATVALVALGGLLLEFSDKLSGVTGIGGKPWAKTHAAQKKQAEIDQRFQQGVVMLHAKQYDHALTAFHRVIELAPEMPEAYVNAGFALLGKGEFKAAADFFDEATTLHSDQANGYYGLALALAGQGDLRTAVEAMSTYLHRAPAQDPYRSKAVAALREWEAALPKSAASPSARPAP